MKGVGDATWTRGFSPRVGVESARGYASEGSADKDGQGVVGGGRCRRGRRATAKCGPPCDEAVGARRWCGLVRWCGWRGCQRHCHRADQRCWWAWADNGGLAPGAEGGANKRGGEEVLTVARLPNSAMIRAGGYPTGP